MIKNIIILLLFSVSSFAQSSWIVGPGGGKVPAGNVIATNSSSGTSAPIKISTSVPQYLDTLAIRSRPSYTRSALATVTNSVIKWDVDTCSTLIINLTADVHLNSLMNIRSGDIYTILIKQDATGGRNVFFPTNFFFSDATGIATTPYSTTEIKGTCDGNNIYCTVVRYQDASLTGLIKSYYDSIEFIITPSLYGNMYRAYGSSFAMVSANSQDVKQFTDPSKNAVSFVSASSGVISATDTRLCLNFNGTTGRLVGVGTRDITFYQGSDFTLCFWVRLTATGATEWILGSKQDGSTTGFTLKRNGSNNLNLAIYAAGLPIIDYTTTFALTSNTWYWVEIRRSGTSGTIKANGTSENLTFTNQTFALGNRDFSIGAHPDGQAYLTGYLGNVILFNKNMTSTATDLFKNVDCTKPVLTESAITLNGTPALNKISHYAGDWDFSDASKNYKDAGTTLVTTNGDNIRRTVSKTGSPITRYIDSGSATYDPVWNTNIKNGLAASTWQNTDKMNIFEQSTYAHLQSAGSWYFVFKLSDTTANRYLISDGSQKGLQITPTTGTDKITPTQQNAQFAIRDSFARNATNYSFSTLIKRDNWNILEVKQRGRYWMLSCNGQRFAEVDNTTYGQVFNIVGHPNTALDFIGNIGEIVFYRTYLTDNQSNTVLSILSKKWGITVSTLNRHEDDGRTTLIQNSSSATDYAAFPVFYKSTADSIAIGYKLGGKHNDEATASPAGSIMRWYNSNMQPISSEIVAFPDITTGALRDHSQTYISKLPNGEYLLCATRYDFQSSVGGRDSLQMVWRKLNNGVLQTINVVATPATYNWFAPTDCIIPISATTWYVPGYASKGAKYNVIILKTVNAGSSWTVLADWDGDALFGGTNPEEPTIKRMSDGRWLLAYRDDTQERIKCIYSGSSDIESWNTSQGNIIDVGKGTARPAIAEVEGRVHILTGANYRVGQRRTVMYSSILGSSTWSSAKYIDAYREDAYGGQCMYGDLLPLTGTNYGKVLAIWGWEGGVTWYDPVTNSTANISTKIIQP